MDSSLARLTLLALLAASIACAPDAADTAEVRRGMFRTPFGVVELQYRQVGERAIVEDDIAYPLPAEDALAGPQLTSGGELESVASAAFIHNAADSAWPGGLVPYTFNTDPSSPNYLAPDLVVLAETAMARWAAGSRIRFAPYDAVDHAGVGRIEFQQSSLDEYGRGTCNSPVGRAISFGGVGAVTHIDLSAECALDSGYVMHEVGHALGLWHEQSRPDRDAHVAVIYRNIPDDLEYNYDKIKLGGKPFGPYDLGSIMHYDGYMGLAIDPSRPVLVYAGTDEPVVANRSGPSRIDICAVNKANNFGATSDLNNDGYDDLVVGVPGQTVGTIVNDAGAISVTYGKISGLGSDNQLITRETADVEDTAGRGDEFGATLAFGDFNGDCYGDVAVGVPGDTVNSLVGAGSVQVFYGSIFGLRRDNDQVWYPDVAGEVRSGMAFGQALAAGDFNGDGLDDLAIGAPLDEVGAVNDAGSVTVLYGTEEGLKSRGAREFTQGSAVGDVAETNDQFGYALTAGDFDGDGIDELVIGVPHESVGATAGAGMVHVLAGTRAGLGSQGNQTWNAGNVGATSASGTPVVAQTNADFGLSLTVGDFNSDGAEDLAIGAPRTGVGGVVDTGTVMVMYGALRNSAARELSPGLRAGNSQELHHDVVGVYGSNEHGDKFGHALAVGDFDANGADDLAIGVPGDTIGGAGGAGGVVIISGRAGYHLGALTSTGFFQNSPGVGSTSEALDFFGERLRAGDYNSDGIVDLAVGVPGEDSDTLADVGVVHLLFGAKVTGVSGTGSQIWSQDSQAEGAYALGARFGQGL